MSTTFRIKINPMTSLTYSGWTYEITYLDSSEMAVRVSAADLAPLLAIPYPTPEAAREAAEKHADRLAAGLAGADEYDYTPSVVGDGAGGDGEAGA